MIALVKAKRHRPGEARKLEALALPRAYVRAWLLARALTLAGFVILLGSVAYSSLR